MPYAGTGYDEYYNGYITPAYVGQLAAPCDSFLCPLNANIYDLDITGFKIRIMPDYQNYHAEKILKEMNAPPRPPPSQRNEGDSSRTIGYTFPGSTVHATSLGTTLVFKNGDYPIQDLRMIEKHYLGGQNWRQFDYSMPFVPPASGNTWEMQYDIEELSEEWKSYLYSNPGMHSSDTFFFVGEQLIMHMRASYSYNGLE